MTDEKWTDDEAARVAGKILAALVLSHLSEMDLNSNQRKVTINTLHDALLRTERIGAELENDGF